jgi:hypothetical protein
MEIRIVSAKVFKEIQAFYGMRFKYIDENPPMVSVFNQIN